MKDQKFMKNTILYLMMEIGAQDHGRRRDILENYENKRSH